MAHNNGFQFAPPPQPGRQPAQYLNHKVSDLSDSPYDDETSSARIRGRESLVSLQSTYYESPRLDAAGDESSYGPGSTWSVPFVGSGGGRYQPVSPPIRSASAYGRFKSFRARAQDTIHEDESIDMSLLGAAAQPGRSGSYVPVSGEEPTEPAVDLSSFSGPMGAQDQEFLRSIQEQEASGKLTGGLGRGMSPKTRIKGDQLIANSPLKRSFTRSFSMRRTPTSKSKAELKELGQSEANRRGEVIEVVMEEPTDVDLSSMVGPSAAGLNSDRIRHSILPEKASKAEVFYPQPNWKPFSMRWPYLTWLILLSVGLAITQEILYRKSAEKPLAKFHSATDLGGGFYFVFKFVPTIVTVTFGVLWQITDFEVRRLEAFYQLSKDGGARAAESINVDYITLFNFARPFLALQRSHYAVAVSSVATLLAVSLVPTLGAAALVVQEDDDPEMARTITVDPVLSRILTTTFFVIAALGCVLFYQLHTRRSGLVSDVRGIAGLACMAVVSHVMMDFKDTDAASPAAIHGRLALRRYALRHSSLVPLDQARLGRKRGDGAQQRAAENPHPVMLRAAGCVPFIAGVLAFLALVPVVLFTPAGAAADKAPWLVTALAVAVKLGWGALETAVRMMEPYYILSRRHAPAATLTLDYTAMPFAVVAARALFDGHWVVFLVGFGAVLVEALTIFATGLATVAGREFLSAVEDHGGDGFLQEGVGSGSETVLSFSITLALTVLILIYLAVVATTVFFRRRHPFLPRQPNSISSVLAFIHQSKMLYDFVGMATFTNAQIRGRLEGLGKTYGLGWFDGRDGNTHLGVEEEELTGDYRHGCDYKQGNKPWLTEWQLF
ncbi:hypothetical protein F4804DRAFT_351231 [Jackrogersella minutella]|nr:hypothetical protein F4804DRAFT_351231 [Jackrogersella minutella]